MATILRVYQSNLKHISRKISQKLNLNFDFEKKVQSIWFNFLELLESDPTNVKKFLTVAKSVSNLAEINRQSIVEGKKEIKTVNSFDYDALFGEIEEIKNEKIPFWDKKMDQEFFKNSKKPFSRFKEKKHKTNFAILNGKKSSKPRRDEFLLIVRSLSKASESKCAGSFVSDYFERVLLLNAFCWLRIEFLVVNFLRMLFGKYQKEGFSRRTDLSKLVRKYIETIWPENKEKLKPIFKFCKSVFFVYLFVYFYLNRNLKEERSISEIIEEIELGKWDMPQTVKDFLAENLKSLSQLLDFKFEKNKPETNFFYVKNSLVFSILIFTFKTESIVLDLSSFSALIQFEVSDWKEIQGLVQIEVNKSGEVCTPKMTKRINEIQIRKDLNQLKVSLKSKFDLKRCLHFLFHKVVNFLNLDEKSTFLLKNEIDLLLQSQTLENFVKSNYHNFFYENEIFVCCFILAVISIETQATFKSDGLCFLATITKKIGLSKFGLLVSFNLKSVNEKLVSSVGIKSLYSYFDKEKRTHLPENESTCFANNYSQELKQICTNYLFENGLNLYLKRVISLDSRDYSTHFIFETLIFEGLCNFADLNCSVESFYKVF